MKRIIAMDVHKASITYAVWQGYDLIEEPKRIPHTRESLQTLARTHPGATALVEACGFHELVHDRLAEEGMQARAFFPPRREPGEKKNDAKDALRIGRRYLAGDLREVWIAPPDIRRLRDIVRYRQRLVEERTSEMNYVQHTLNRWGMSMFNPFTSTNRPRVIAQFPLLRHSYERLDATKPVLRELDKLVSSTGKEIPAVKRLRSIKGWGSLTSLVYYAEIGDIKRFPSADHVISYFGLDPAWGQSGDKAWDLHHISRQGRSYVRGILNEAAWAHVNHAPDSDITKAFHAHAQKTTRNQSILKTSAALAKAAYHVWKDDREFTMNWPARFAPCRVPTNA